MFSYTMEIFFLKPFNLIWIQEWISVILILTEFAIRIILISDWSDWQLGLDLDFLNLITRTFFWILLKLILNFISHNYSIIWKKNSLYFFRFCLLCLGKCLLDRNRYNKDFYIGTSAWHHFLESYTCLVISTYNGRGLRTCLYQGTIIHF